MNESTKPIAFFDGVCNLCNGLVQFLIKLDPKAKIRFASLQSEIAKELLPAEVFNQPDGFSTFLFLKNGKLYEKSAAAIEIGSYLGGIFKIAKLGYLLPAKVRDGIYNLISRNRYKWFGKQTACWVPSPELKTRFL